MAQTRGVLPTSQPVTGIPRGLRMEVGLPSARPGMGNREIYVMNADGTDRRA